MLLGVLFVKSYVKVEDNLRKYYDGRRLRGNAEELNVYMQEILNKLKYNLLNAGLNKSEISESEISELVYNFTSELLSMPISVFNKSYTGILAFMSLSVEDQEMLLRSLDIKFNTCIFDNERIVKKIQGYRKKITEEISFRPHQYNPIDILNFFKMFQIRINRFVDQLLINYLKAKVLDSNTTFDEQSEKIKQLIESVNDCNSELNNFIFKNYINWIQPLPCFMKDFYCQSMLDIILQIPASLNSQLTEINIHKTKEIANHQKEISSQISHYYRSKEGKPWTQSLK